MLCSLEKKTQTFLSLKRFNSKSLTLFIALNLFIIIQKVRNLDFSYIGSSLVKFILIYVLTFLPPLNLASNSAYASNLPITPDGSTNTQIDSAANGVPIVNIAAPNSGGLSHNKFHDYNVNPSGLVINNATGNPNQVVRTEIGGLITDNPNLRNSGSARVILNEVTSTNRSILNGYTEIGGRQADLIIANPNGIEMNSAGFINIGRLTAVVGSANQFNPNPSDLSFNLNGNKNSGNGFLPKLTISGLGLDVTRVTETDLVANIMEIVSPIYGGDNRINLRAGDKEFNYSTKEVTSDNTTPGSNQPDEVAIDASNVAKVQAGQIYMIATKEGFGVKYTGDMLASRAGVIIDAKGDIVYNNIASESGGVNVKTANGDVTATGITHNKDTNSDIAIEASGNVNNQGQIVSARDVNVTAGNTFNNTGTEINLSDRNFTINANQVNNSGNLSAANNLNVTADIVNNSKEIIANNEIVITGNQITNDDSIIAGNKVSITAKDYLTNNNDILSLVSGASEDSLIINALTLNNNKRIAANSILTINANSLNNNTANSLIISGGNANLNITNLDNNLGAVESKNNLKIRNLTSNNADAALLLSVSDTNTNISNSGTLKATNSIDINLGSSDYNIIGKLETDGFINIQANNITNKGDVGAIDYIKIVAGDSFTNGINGGDNSNIKIATNNYLDIESNNNINNYATLSAKTILSLTSLNGNINNYSGAELIASNQDNPGTSELILEAINGTINQNSPNSVVVDGNHTITADYYTNTGRIDISGDLTMDITYDLINDIGALIYAGNDMFLNIGNDLANREHATIYAENDLFIRKYDPSNPNYDATNNRINKFENISGNIETYAGNISIKADTFSNSRNVDPVSNLVSTNANCRASGSNIICNSAQYSDYATNHNLYSWSRFNGWGWGEFGYTTQYRTTQGSTNSSSKSAVISSGGSLDIDSDTFSNHISEIYSIGDMTISANNTSNFNTSFTYGETIVWTAIYDGIGGWPSWCGGAKPCRRNEYSFSNFQTYLSYIKSGGSLTITQNGSVNTSLINGSNVDNYASLDGPAGRDLNSVNGVNISNLDQTGVLDIDLSGYLNGPDNQGMFSKNPNPNGPLFETRSQFVDQSKFFGSDYFYQKIGLDLTDVQTEFEQQNKRLVGDQFFQTKIIEEQLRTVKKNSLLISEGSDITSTSQEIKSLFDNASEEFFRLGFAVDEPLTQTQIDSLEKDIVWFETKIIDGQAYVAPKIYLSKATRDNLDQNNLASKSTIFGKTSVNLTSNNGDIENNGSIVGGAVSLTANNDVINKNFSDITSSGDLDINADNGSIVNFSKLKATGAISLTAKNDITNTSTVATNDTNLLTSGNPAYTSDNLPTLGPNETISSIIFETAAIESGSLDVNAGNDFNNYGGNITTTGNADIVAGNDVNVESVVLRNRSEEYWGSRSNGGVKITDTTKNISSNIDIGGNLNLLSGNDANIKGSNILVTGNADIKTGNELNIASAQDSYYTYEASNKKKSFGRGKNSSSTTEIKTQVASNIVVGGDILLDGVSDVNIIASNLRGENGRIVSQAGNVNIKNGINSVKSYTTSKKKGSTAKSSSKVYDYQEAAAESILAFNNDLQVNAELGDVNIQGSTLDVNNDLSFGSFTIAQNPDGSLKTKADGTFETVSGDVVQNVNITAAELKSEHWEEHKSTSFNPITAAMAAVGEIASLGGLNPVADKLNEKLQERVNDLAGADNKAMVEKTESKSGKSETIAHSSNITVDGNLNVNASEGFKIAGSNLDVGGDGNINAAKVDIISAQEKSSSYKKDKSIVIGETDVGFRDNSFKAGIKGTGEENLYQEENTVQKASNVNIGNNLLINSTNDIDVVASNVAVGNDAVVKTGGNFNLSDAKNTQNTNTENSKLEVEVGVKVGNAYVDAGVAVDALADATKNLKKAKEKLSRMKRLKSEGRASQKAVDLAYTQVALATAGVATATANVAMAAQNAATAASTSLGTGMYAAGYMDTTYHTDFLKTSSEQSVGSSFVAGNNIDINANKDYNQTASVLKSNNGNINIVANEANIKSGESTFQSEFGSKTTTASVSVGNNGVGLSAGYNQSDNFILQNTHTNSEILAENGTFNLNTTGDTNIKGGNVTANQVALNIGGDLNLETLQDTYEQQGSSFGLGVGVGVNQSASLNNASISLGATEIFTKTTGKRTGIVALASNDNNLSEAENLTNLLASTSVNVAGNIDNQTVKKDIDFTNADFEGTLSVPVELFTESGRARMKDAFENLGTNLKTTAYGASNTVKNAVNATTGVITGGNKGASIVDSFKARQTEQVVALKMGSNSNNRQTINNLGSKEQNASDIQKAVRSGDENSRVYYDENAAEAGFHDNSTGDVYINLAKGENSNVTNATNTESLLFVSGHERGHRYSDNEGFADTIGNEAKSAWNAVNWIYGDSIGSNPSVTNNSWANHNGVGNNPISNTNQLVQNSILQHNNQIASNVAPENRDNFIPAIPLAYALAGTVLTNEYLKSQGGGDAGVGAHRVANQVKEGVSTAYEGVKSVDPHLRQSLENVEAGVSFVTQKAIRASDIAVSSIFDTNTNKPVTVALQEANQWHDNLPESQKGSVDLAMLLSSVAGGSYFSTANKAINKPDVNLGSVGNNSPGISNPIPETFARVIPGTKASNTLGLPGSSDVFVTDAKILKGLTPQQISSKLAIDPRDKFTIIEFPSRGIEGIASPINRDYSKFIGGGKTAGGAPEFVIPNGPIPSNSKIKIITE